MSWNVFYWSVAIYCVVGLVTFGHLYRSLGRLKPKHYLYVAAAPAYWIVTKGVKGTLEQIVQSVFHPVDDVVFWGLSLLAVGHYLAHSWASVSGFSEVVLTLITAAMIFLPPGALVYWGWALAKFF